MLLVLLAMMESESVAKISAAMLPDGAVVQVCWLNDADNLADPFLDLDQQLPEGAATTTCVADVRRVPGQRPQSPNHGGITRGFRSPNPQGDRYGPAWTRRPPLASAAPFRAWPATATHSSSRWPSTQVRQRQVHLVHSGDSHGDVIGDNGRRRARGRHHRESTNISERVVFPRRN
jgi:hypothetical protein